jgi:DNA-binding NarL/FixJ family response regulator
MILIASNNPKLVNRWSRSLRKKYPLYTVSQKTALIRATSSLKPPVLILDVGLPRLRAARELPDIQKLSPLTKILVLSASPTTREGISLLKAGAKGYCGQEISAVLVQKAVRAALRDELWAGRRIVSELINEVILPNTRTFFAKSKIPLDRLSPRKRQVAAIVMEGASNKEIANRLNITEAAVKSHLIGIFRQLKLSRRHELARLFEVPTMANEAGRLPSRS